MRYVIAPFARRLDPVRVSFTRCGGCRSGAAGVLFRVVAHRAESGPHPADQTAVSVYRR